jgi:hypothetical protein
VTSIHLATTINDSGTVAFWGEFPSGSVAANGIFTQSALLAKSGDTIGGQTLTFINIFAPTINDSGTVAFVGSFAGGEGIFTQSALVAKSGDTIGGKTLATVFPPVINAGGTVAFSAFFTDFSQGIITAQLFAGTPGQANCHGASVSSLSQEFGTMDAAAAALGFTSVHALQDAIKAFCQ